MEYNFDILFKESGIKFKSSEQVASFDVIGYDGETIVFDRKDFDDNDESEE